MNYLFLSNTRQYSPISQRYFIRLRRVLHHRSSFRTDLLKLHYDPAWWIGGYSIEIAGYIPQQDFGPFWIAMFLGHFCWGGGGGCCTHDIVTVAKPHSWHIGFSQWLHTCCLLLLGGETEKMQTAKSPIVQLPQFNRAQGMWGSWFSVNPAWNGTASLTDYHFYESDNLASQWVSNLRQACHFFLAIITRKWKVTNYDVGRGGSGNGLYQSAGYCMLAKPKQLFVKALEETCHRDS